MKNYREQIENLFFKGLLGNVENEHDWDLAESYEHIYNRILGLLEISDINIEIGNEDGIKQASMDYKVGDKLYFIVFDTDVCDWIGDEGVEKSIIDSMVDILEGYEKCKDEFNYNC